MNKTVTVVLCILVVIATIMRLYGFNEAKSMVKEGEASILTVTLKMHNMNFVSRSGFNCYISKFTTYNKQLGDLNNLFN